MMQTLGQQTVRVGNMPVIIWLPMVMWLFLLMLFIGVNAGVKKGLMVVSMPIMRGIL